MKINATIEHIKSIRPSFGQDVVGCSEEEVAKLESVLGYAVPVVYREFLLTMGRDAGGIETYYSSGTLEPVDFCYLSILQRERKAKDRWPERLVPIGEGTMDPYETITLDTGTSLREESIIRHNAGRAPEQVARLLSGAGNFEVAASFGEMLFAAAFASFECPRFRRVATLLHDEHTNTPLSAAEKALRRLGFDLHPGSRGYTKCFVRFDAAAIAYRNSRESLKLKVFTTESRNAERYAAILQQELGSYSVRVEEQRRRSD